MRKEGRIHPTAEASGFLRRSMKERRIGKFYATQELVESVEMVILLQELQFIPYRAEFLFHMGAFEYIGYSPSFRQLDISEMIPTYKPIFNKLEDGSIKIEVKLFHERS